MRHPSLVERPDDPAPESQQERAIRSLEAIFSGADLTAETTQLANDFTDRQSGRLTGWLKRKRGGNDEQ
jgi:hypothetical protein